MTILEAIESRHSVRRYLHKPLEQDIIDTLQAKVDKCNARGCLHIQLVTNETKAFTGIFAYGSFSGVENYFVMVGKKEDGLDERIGYYGEQLVLLAQQLGLNTCWTGLSYRKVKGAYDLGQDEKICCMIALGYGENQGMKHKIKTFEQVSNASDLTPSWFKDGVEAALLAPTAVNQQKFSFEYLGNKGGHHLVKADKGFSMIGYTHMDLGIAKLHFEIGAGKDKFDWV
ncbi:nitroreductase family protein [Phocaeicola oris]|uniref:nitroreductase family protein n=1 Tax=Phocaeicola oris TaxID=2896850 RepID=UPI00234F34EF|nr:nitroreductase family protein [Phocaeicola oris]MCE2615332.1 nitroreductase [Phocaeicola oris]